MFHRVKSLKRLGHLLKRQKMKKVYGKPIDITDASFIYRKGDVELIFIYEDDDKFY